MTIKVPRMQKHHKHEQKHTPPHLFVFAGGLLVAGYDHQSYAHTQKHHKHEQRHIHTHPHLFVFAGGPVSGGL